MRLVRRADHRAGQHAVAAGADRPARGCRSTRQQRHEATADGSAARPHQVLQVSRSLFSLLYNWDVVQNPFAQPFWDVASPF